MVRYASIHVLLSTEAAKKNLTLLGVLLNVDYTGGV